MKTKIGSMCRSLLRANTTSEISFKRGCIEYLVDVLFSSILISTHLNIAVISFISLYVVIMIIPSLLFLLSVFVIQSYSV